MILPFEDLVFSLWRTLDACGSLNWPRLPTSPVQRAAWSSVWQRWTQIKALPLGLDEVCSHVCLAVSGITWFIAVVLELRDAGCKLSHPCPAGAALSRKLHANEVYRHSSARFSATSGLHTSRRWCGSSLVWEWARNLFARTVLLVLVLHCRRLTRSSKERSSELNLQMTFANNYSNVGFTGDNALNEQSEDRTTGYKC